MLKKILDIRNAYHDAKAVAVEESVTAIESDSRSWLGLFFVIVDAMLWGAALEEGFGLEALYNSFGFFYPAVAVFAITYFGVFLTSKLIVRPTLEERTDDTSLFAVFSACRRRELRSLISSGFAVVHVLIFGAYLASKDSGLLEQIR